MADYDSDSASIISASTVTSRRGRILPSKHKAAKQDKSKADKENKEKERSRSSSSKSTTKASSSKADSKARKHTDEECKFGSSSP